MWGRKIERQVSSGKGSGDGAAALRLRGEDLSSHRRGESKAAGANGPGLVKCTTLGRNNRDRPIRVSRTLS